MTGLLILDAVVMPHKEFLEAMLWIMLIPFLFAIGIIVFFRLTDRLSAKRTTKTD